MSPRLIDLDPRFSFHTELSADRTRIEVYDVNRGDLSFVCPRCGAPFRISVNFRRGGPAAPDIWAADYDDEKFLTTVTLTPSIDNKQAHPIKHAENTWKECGWHGNITNGDVNNS